MRLLMKMILKNNAAFRRRLYVISCRKSVENRIRNAKSHLARPQNERQGLNREDPSVDYFHGQRFQRLLKNTAPRRSLTDVSSRSESLSTPSSQCSSSASSSFKYTPIASTELRSEYLKSTSMPRQ